MKLPRGLFLRLFRLPNFSQILTAHCQTLWPQRCSISKNTFARFFYFHLKILEMWMQRLDPPKRMEKKNEETVERWRYALERMVNASANRNRQGNLPFYAKVLPFILAASFSFLFFLFFFLYFTSSFFHAFSLAFPTVRRWCKVFIYQIEFSLGRYVYVRVRFLDSFLPFFNTKSFLPSDERIVTN